MHNQINYRKQINYFTEVIFTFRAYFAHVPFKNVTLHSDKKSYVFS